MDFLNADVQLNGDPKRFTQLVHDSGYKIIHNTVKHQFTGDEVNTCGRWCVFRLIYQNMPLREFNRFLKNIKEQDKVKLDYVITAFTSLLSGAAPIFASKIS